MDAGRFYALLRFEEASLALRTVLHMGLVEQMGDRGLPPEELRETWGFSEQAARTFFALLQVMHILELRNGNLMVTQQAREFLSEGRSTSRKPYLSMGTATDVVELLNLLKGLHPDTATPLYGMEDSGETVMDMTDIAREIAYGLGSRARNFAVPLADAVAARIPNARSIADIGAGSPWVAQACLRTLPDLDRILMVDRANGMRFVHEMIRDHELKTDQFEFHEQDFFRSVPPADVFILSNTAHDWTETSYGMIIKNIRQVIPDDGLLCIHEPLLLTAWKSEAEWIHALWMACYALTLLRLTLGQGTCYSIEEHHRIVSDCGFEPVASPVATSDGCTALFYRPKQ